MLFSLKFPLTMRTEKETSQNRLRNKIIDAQQHMRPTSTFHRVNGSVGVCVRVSLY